MTFFGRGYGHGVGMSQYGARGRALAGQTAATILAHYYRGTTLGIDLDERRRSASASCPAGRPRRRRRCVVYGRLAAWTIDGIAGTFPADAALAPDPDDDLDGDRPANDLAAAGHRCRAAPSCTTRRSRPASSSAARRPAAGSSCGPSRARTTATAAPCGSSPRRRPRPSRVVNELPLETYLRGVVPVEMPSTWPTAGAQGPGDRVPLVRRPPAAPGRLVLRRAPTTRARRSTTGRSARRPPTNAIIGATAGVVLRSRAAPSPTRCSTRPAAARPRTTRTSTCRRPARRSPAP